jgi:Cu(I)/Ag(I) efflux system membrane fusion protein
MYAKVSIKSPIAELPAFRERLARRRSDQGGGESESSIDGQKNCPVTGASIEKSTARSKVQLAGRTVWTCGPECAAKVKASPATYLAKTAPPPDRVLSIPEAAVIDTGSRRLVFVESSPGVFDGREVVLGPRSGDRYPVLEGLSVGEKVAAAGSFLIDAETRLNPRDAIRHVGGNSVGGPTARRETKESRAGR